MMGLLVLVTLLPYGEAGAPGSCAVPPALDGGGVLEAVVGPWGAVFVSIGLLLLRSGRVSGLDIDLR